MKISRRHTLKSLGVGSIWVTPIIESVLLPVHAQTSSMLIYSTINNGPGPRKVSALIESDRVTIRVRYFFDGGCMICGNDVDYESVGSLPSGEGTLNVISFGCGTVAPSVLGAASIHNYTFGDPQVVVSITSSEVGDSIVTVPIGGDFDLGPYLCS